jgi:PKD repeat protein
VNILLTGVANSTAPAFPVAPNPPFTFTPANPERSVPVRFDASGVTDEGVLCMDKCSYFWNFGDGSMDTGRIVNHTFTSPGTYTVAVTVMDAAGSVASAARAVTVANVAAPTVTLTVTPNLPVAGHDTTLTATATAASGHGIVRYVWNFGDGTTTTTTGPTATMVYQRAGTYVATVTVTDDLGQSASASIRINIGGSGVTAEITVSPAEPLVGQLVQFNGSGSLGAAGSTITLWSWDFGDGTTFEATTPTASHAYTAAGTYTVRLTVTDSGGRTGTTTASVAVQ